MTVWLDQKTRKYIAKFKYKGATYKKKGFKKRSKAVQWEAATRDELENPKPQTTRLTFGDICDLYLEYCKPRMGHNTCRQKAFVYAMFLGHLQIDPLAIDVTQTTILEYLEARRTGTIDIPLPEVSPGVKQKPWWGKGNKAANRDLRDISALYKWVIDKGNRGFTVNPCRGIDPYPEQQRPGYTPPAEDIDAVLLAASDDDLDLVFTLYHTAARVGELFRLTWEHVNLERGTITLSTKKRRGGKLEDDTMPMTDPLAEVMARRWKHRDKASPYVFVNPRSGEPYTYDSRRGVMARLCKRAGVKAFGFHAIRHHIASILMDSGKATLSQIQKWLRHKRMTTTERYLHTLERNQVEIAKLIVEEKKSRKSKKDEEGSS